MIQATNRFVFIIRDNNEDGEFFIPEQGREKPHSGQILSVGGLVQDKKIKSGKKCLFHKGVGFTIPFEDKEYLVLTDEQVIAIV